MSCLCHYGPALLRFWFQTYLGHENSASYLKTQAEKTFCYHGHALVTLWLVKIWQVSSCGKLMHHLETCLLWQLKLTEFCVNFRVNLWCFLMSFSTGSTKCNTAAIKSLLLFLAGWFIGFLVEKCSILKLVYFDSWSCQSFMKLHGWFVYWIFGWKMRRLSKSEIRFRMTSFSFFTLLDAGWKVPQAAFRSCISNGKSE